MSGTYNITREIWDHPAFPNEPFTKREAWIWMIGEASWKARTRRVGSFEVETQRGQLAASLRFLARAWQWTEPKVRRYFDMLEKRRMIERVTDAGVTVVTICNYDNYQAKPKNADAPSTHDATQDRRTIDANENKGEIRGKKEKDIGASPAPAGAGSQKASRRKPETQVPDGFQPSAKGREFAAEKGMKDIDREVEKFIAHHEAKGSKFRSWDAAWRTWAINHQKFGPSKANVVKFGAPKGTTSITDDGWTHVEGSPYEFGPNGEIREPEWKRRQDEAEMWAAIGGRC